MFSVVDGQPEELQQLPVVQVDEVRRFLPAVVFQLGVGAQLEKVAGRNTIQHAYWKGTNVGTLAKSIQASAILQVSGVQECSKSASFS